MSDSTNNFLDRLDNISIQANLYKDDDDVLKELEDNPDSNINEYLKLIKRLNTQAKAKIHQQKQQQAIDKLNQVIENLPIFSSLLSKPQYASLNALFSQYTQLTEEDKQSIIEDNLLLDFLNEIDNAE